MTSAPHQIRITLGREGKPRTLDKVEEFELTTDMLEFADSFSLSTRFDRELWALAQPDSEVEIWIDDVRVLTGFIDEVERPFQGGGLRITGRDKGGRLVDEAAPLFSFDGLGIREFAEKLVIDWFEEVVLSNARNRALIRGSGRRLARVAKEPPILAGRFIQKKVEPGETIVGVLSHVLEEADLLGWSSADGREFIVGKPNYDQEAQWRFFFPERHSLRANEANALGGTYKRSVTDRYSIITAMGSSKGDSARYGPNVTRKKAAVRNGPNADGTGKDFVRRKKLIVSDDDVRSQDHARVRAEREMALRDASGETLEIIARGFGQRFRGQGEPVIFAFDTLATWEDEEAEVSGEFFVTRVQFRETPGEGQRSTLSLVPRGTELRLQ